MRSAPSTKYKSADGCLHERASSQPPPAVLPGAGPLSPGGCANAVSAPTTEPTPCERSHGGDVGPPHSSEPRSRRGGTPSGEPAHVAAILTGLAPQAAVSLASAARQARRCHSSQLSSGAFTVHHLYGPVPPAELRSGLGQHVPSSAAPQKNTGKMSA